MQQDVHFKKEVSLNYEGHRLRLRVAQELFSSAEVDVGTRLLLRTLGQGDRGTFAKVLDLGSGYGPLGLALKKADNARLVHMVDRDALAVDYTRQNAELNRLSGVEVYGSLGYDDVSTRDFDLIVSNVPAKADESAISHFLLGAVHYLSPGGVVAVVIIAPLASTVAGILDREANIEVLFRRDTPTYTVLHYRFSSPADGSGRSEASGMAEGAYDRGKVTASFRGVRYALETAYGLPEFDSPGYQSRLLMETIEGIIKEGAVRRAVVFNPGQGHVAVVLWKLARPGAISLIGRDLLSLRYARRNLLLNGCPEE